MEQPKKASFGFKKFTVPQFSYNSSKDSNPELDLMFDPSGEYNESEGEYYLTLNFKGVENKNTVISVTSVAEFKFSEKLKKAEIPDFFYTNSIAIMFPYVRAFISNLTLQSNTGLIMLETLNLTSLRVALKSNTKLKSV